MVEQKIIASHSAYRWGVVASWLRSSSDQVVWSLALAGEIVLSCVPGQGTLLSLLLYPLMCLNGYW